MKVGDKFKADGQVRRCTVQAIGERFIIMTKPFAAKKTYLYTIADLHRGVRGTCNLIFGLPCDVDTPSGAADALALMIAGEFDVSCRNVVELSEAEIAQLRGGAA